MDVPELMPMDDYNPKKAQLQTCIQWLLSKAYGNAIPQEAEQPFYHNNQGLLCLKPGIANGLTSADLYCRACTNIFKDSNTQWQGHWSIIQALSRKGIFVVEGKDSAVTETSLLQTSPFKINSHLALIRSLMMAYVREIVTIERVVQAVKKFANVTASNELPYDPEDALLFWINKVCSTLRHRLERELHEKPFDQIHRQEDDGEVGVPDIPVMDDLLKDLNDGCCLAALMSFYCPDTCPLTEVALGNQLAIADSLHNLQIIQKFVERYLPVRCLHMNINDLFYTPEQLKVAVTVFLAEVFYWLEINPVPSVRDVSIVPYYLTADQDTENRSRPDTAKQLRSSSAGRAPPISNATKRSFQAPERGSGSPSDSNSQIPPPRQPLLPKRMQQRNSLHDGDYHFDPEATRQSVRAWEDEGVANGRPHGDGPHGDGPHGDEPHGDGPRQSESPARGRVRPSSANPQLQSSGLTNVTSANTSGGLLSNVSIDPEMSLDTDVSVDFRDDSNTGKNTYRANPNSRHNANDLHLESISSRSAGSTARGGQMEPLMLAKLKPSKEKSADQMTKEYESGENRNSKPAKPTSLNFSANRNDSSSSDTTPEEDYQTPSVENVPLPGEHLQGGAPKSNEGEPSQNSKGKQFEAFFVDTNHTAASQGSSPNRRAGKSVGRGEGEAQVGDRRSNGEAFYLNLDEESNPQRPDSLIFQASSSSNASSGERPSPKTSFAQIKKQKDSGEVSPILYQSPKKGALKGDGTSGAMKGQKKTTFAALPNQTTWQESALKSNNSDNPREGDAGEQPLTTELINLRMQLEERRRQMETEKHRMAMQWTKQRQRMSKQAFIQVITKKDDGSEGEPNMEAAAEAQHQKDAERKRKEDEERKKLEEKRREEAKREEQRRKEEQRREEERQREKEREEREEELRKEREKFEREEQEREDELRRAMEKEDERKRQKEEEKMRQKEEKRRQKEQKKEEERVERERVEERLRELERQREIEAEKLRDLERQRNLELGREGSPLDHGRSKWSTPPSNGRPVSFNAGHEATPPPYQGLMSTSDERYYPPAPESTSSAESTSTSGEYGTSLDRLNTSLNELQGEIMRLSLQQDHIKSLVNEPRTMSPSGEQPSQKSWDKFHQSPSTNPGDPDMSSSGAGEGQMRTSGGYNGSYQDPMRTSGGYNSAAAAGPMAVPPMYPTPGIPYGGPNQMYGPPFMPPGYPHPYMPPGQPASTYPVGMQQYPQPMYQQPGMYQGGPYQGQWPPGVAPPGAAAPHLPPGAYPATSQPHAQTHMSTAQTAQMSPSSEYPYDHSNHSPEGASSPMNHSSPHVHSPGDTNGSDAVSSPFQKTDVIESHDDGDDDPNPSSPQQPAAANKGFFVSFEIESPSPRKSKPKLPSARKKESSSSPVRKEVVPPPITAKPEAPDLSDLIEPERACNVMSAAPPTSPPRPAPEPTPAVRFVIDAEGPTQDEIDFEKKRQKVLEMQIKRREEQEKKKAKLEADRLKKSEMERAKQEQSEQKKADDKARRDQIFQQYLAKKAEREISEEESKAGIRDNVPRRPRQQGKKITRPHSQPPSPAVVAATTDDKHSVSSQSHSSQEDLSAKVPGNIMSTSASKITPPEEGVDGAYLSFGAMTHRRPPSPGWAKSPYSWRATASNSLGRNFSGKRASPAAVGEGDSNSLTSQNAALATGDYSGRSLPLSSRLLSGSVSSLATTKVVAPPIKKYGGSTTSLVSKAYGGSMTSLSAKHSASTTNLSSRSGSNGPKLFVKPSQKSNRNIISNALCHCCLAGIVNTDLKNKMLEEVAKCDAKHFLVLFRDHGQQFRSIYAFNPETEEISKISGNGPKSITNGMVERFYKYNSGAKSFTEVTSTKHISVSIDAITLYNHFWQKKVVPTTRKANLY